MDGAVMMTAPETTIAHQTYAAVSIGRFARVDLVGAALGLVGVTVVNVVGVQSALLWIIPAALAGLVVALFAAIRASDNGRFLAAIGLITAGHWLVALVVPIALPFLWPIAVLVVVVPLVLAAPHVPLVGLLWQIAGAAAVAAGAALIGLNADDAGVVPDIDDELELVIVVLMLAVMMVPIALVVWQNNRSQRRALDAALILNAELSRSRRRVVEASNDARRRIERDLHDGAQQRLVALGMRMRSLESQVDTTTPTTLTSPTVSAALSGLIDEVDLTLDELRDLAHGVYPPVLATHGLGPAFTAIAQRSPGRIIVDDRLPTGTRPPRPIEEALYFTGLEAIANATKHAPDAPIRVVVAPTAGGLDVVIDDDGPGFDVAASADASGLSNMRDRVESLGGRLTIEAAPGTGTTVTASVPSH